MSICFHLEDAPQLRLEVSVESQITKQNILSRLFFSLPDIDSGIILRNKEGKAIDESYYGQLASRDGSIQHRSDDTVNTPLIPTPTLITEQYDIDFSHVNYSIDSFSLYVYSSSPLDIEHRKVEKINMSLTVPDSDIVVYTSSHQWNSPGFQGIHVGNFKRLSKKEWQFDSEWKPGAYTDIRSCHYIAYESTDDSVE